MALPQPALAQPVQYMLNSDVELQARLCTKGLRVVEVYSEWCGPCRSIIPTLRKMRMDKDDEAALTFLAMPAEKCEMIEAAREHRGRSEPLFLFIRNGNIKAKVLGANVPALMAHVAQLTPANAEADDLEENPMFQARKKQLSSSSGGAEHASGHGPAKKR